MMADPWAKDRFMLWLGWVLDVWWGAGTMVTFHDWWWLK